MITKQTTSTGSLTRQTSVLGEAGATWIDAASKLVSLHNSAVIAQGNLNRLQACLCLKQELYTETNAFFGMGIEPHTFAYESGIKAGGVM